MKESLRKREKNNNIFLQTYYCFLSFPKQKKPKIVLTRMKIDKKPHLSLFSKTPRVKLPPKKLGFFFKRNDTT
jgi:hypothetical protein